LLDSKVNPGKYTIEAVSVGQSLSYIYCFNQHIVILEIYPYYLSKSFQPLAKQPY